MRLPWFTRGPLSRGTARRKRPAPLKVRRLERRRVLDAAVTDLIFAPADVDGSTAVHDSNEGTQVTVTADASGSGVLSFNWTATKDAMVVAQSNNPTFQFTPQDNGDYTVTLTVTDGGDATMATRIESLVVHNVRPVLVVPLDQTVDEGALLNLSAVGAPPLGLFIDKGQDDTHTATVDWGDGSTIESPTIYAAAGSGTLGGTHTYTDDGVYEVIVMITDDDGGSDTKSFLVTVNNVAPTASLTNSGPVDEGSSATVSFSGQFDPSSDDTAAGFRYAYDLNNDGTFDVGDGSYAGSVASATQMVSAALLVDGPGAHTVKARIIDQDGDFTDYTTTITINNVAPKLVNLAAEDDTLDEGDTATIRMVIDDPGATDVFAIDVDWQDGGPIDTVTGLGLANTSGTVGGTTYEWDAQSRQLTVSHLYRDDNPTNTPSDNYAVALVVRDDDLGTSAPYQVDILVNNVRPVLVTALDQSVDEGSLLDLSGMGAPPLALYVDDGVEDTHTATVDWGDGSALESPNVFGGPGFGTLGATHAYQDEGTYTVTVTVTDDDGGVDTKSFQVTVLNAPPTIDSLTVTSPINEGESATLSGTYSDPGVLDTHELDIDWDGDNVFDQTVTVSGGTFSIDHLYPDDNPTGTPSDTFTIHVQLRDNAGGSDLDDVDLTVNNVRPVLVVAGDQSVDEGSLLDLSGMGAPPLALFVDDGVEDTHTVTVNWGDGTGDESLTPIGGGGAFAVGGTHTYVDDGIYLVTVKVTDDDGGVDMQSFQVTVLNVAPTLENVAATDDSINEGEAAEITATINDPGALDTFSVDVNWRDNGPVDTITGLGLADASGTVGSTNYVWDADTRELTVSHLYKDDNPTGTASDLYTVSLVVRDDDLAATGPYDVDITVSNVRPVLVVAADQTVDEGSLLNLSAMGAPPLALFIDDGVEDIHTVTINWGDGTGDEAVVPIGGGGAFAVGGTHTYADDGLYQVTVTVMDDDGGVDSQSFFVTVNNVDPMLNVTPSTDTINEGGSVSFDATFSDPGFDNPLNPGAEKEESFTYDVDWGDGRDMVNGQSVADTNGMPGTPSTGMFGGAHTYADNGVYTVKVTIHDDDGGSHVQMFTVTVLNVDPALTGTSGHVLDEGEIFTLTSLGIGITDPGFDNPLNTLDPANGGETAETFEVMKIDWGDGLVDDNSDADLSDVVSIVNRVPGGVGVPTTAQFDHAAHAYADNGNYTVTITLRDDDGGFVDLQFSILVNNVDPSLTGIENVSVDEGQAFTLDGVGVGLSDPGFDNPANAGNIANGGETEETFTSFMIDWGDGTAATPVTVVDRVSGSLGTPTTAHFDHAAHTYADNGVYTVQIMVQDDDGPVVTRELTITVNNVDPSLTGTTNLVVNESQSFTLDGLGVGLSDPGFDNPLNAPNVANGGETQELFLGMTIDWGDGTATTPATAVNRVSGSPGTPTTAQFSHQAHTYADNGVYTLTVLVQDDDGPQVARQFTITVNNLPPVLNTFPDGKKLQGDDINTNGQTTIRLSLHDPGFDNPLNQLNAANGGEFYETFTQVVDWGDGTVDAIHSYASTPSGPIMVSINGGPATVFAANGDVNRVLTVVSSQVGLYDPGVPASLYTYQVDWGDGTVDTFQLLLKSPGPPGDPTFSGLASNGQTVVIAAPRVSGAVGVETTAAAEVQHTYLGPPDPLHPTNDVPIRLTTLDDDGGQDGGINDANAVIFVSNPGIHTIMVAIDTTPDVPRLDLTVQPMTAVYVPDQGGLAQRFQTPDVRGGGGEVAATTERYLELRIVYPDGTESEGHRIPDDALADLREFFKSLPDGRYRIYLVRTENHSERLVIQVDVRRGHVIDVSDDSEGTRDRPPTDEGETPQAEPSDQNSDGPGIPPADGQRQGDRETRRQGELANSTEQDDRRVSLSPPLLVSLSATALAIEPWSERVDAALGSADERAWRRLRRAGRRGLGTLPGGVPPRLRTLAGADYNRN